MTELQGRTALITGASRGLGKETARIFAARGVNVVLAARDSERIAAIAGEIEQAGGKAIAVGCDVANYEAVDALARQAVARFGRIDILVNNAGVIDPIAHIATSDPAAWAQSISINLIGAYNVVRAVLPSMLEKKAGTIVNISSGAAYRALEGWSAYCSGKAGLAMLTSAIQMETAAQGIRIFGFSPGTIDTDMQATIRASGLNPISKIPKENLLPVADAVRGIFHLCGSAGDDLIGKDVSMRDDDFRARIGLAAV